MSNRTWFDRLRSSAFEILLVVLVVATHASAVFAPANSLMNWFSSDDAFYYFKVAQNISEGYGVTFDRIGRTNGFHPLWMLVCIPIFALARFDLILPLRILVVVLVLLNAASGVVFYRLLGRVLSRPTSALLALLWVFLPRVHQVTTLLGMETGLNTFLTLCFLAGVVNLELRRQQGYERLAQQWWLGGVAALTLLSRLDNIFLIAILGIWVVFRAPRLRWLLLGDGLLIAASVFGSFLLRLGLRSYFPYAASAVWMASAALAIKLFVYLALGLYDSAVLKPSWRGLLRLALGALLGWLGTVAVMLALIGLGKLEFFPRSALILDGLFTLLAVVGLRYGVGWLTRKQPETADSLYPLAGLRDWARWRRWFSEGGPNALLRFYLPVGAALGLYMLWSYLHTGTPSPVSGQIKRWWGSLYTVYGHPARTVQEVFGLASLSRDEAWSLVAYLPKAATDYATRAGRLPKDPDRADRLYYRIFRQYSYGMAAATLLLLGLNWRKALEYAGKLLLVPWFAACQVQITSYTLTGYVAAKDWYWVAQMLLVAALVGIVVECAFLLLRRLGVPQVVFWGVVGVLGVLTLLSFRAYLAYLVPWKVEVGEEEAYLAGMRELESFTEPGSVIGSTGGGSVAYFIRDRTIVNLDGLINSYEYFRLLQSGQASAYLDRLGMDYVFGSDYMLRYSEPYAAMFKGRLEEIGQVAGVGLYHYRR